MDLTQLLVFLAMAIFLGVNGFRRKKQREKQASQPAEDVFAPEEKPARRRPRIVVPSRVTEEAPATQRAGFRTTVEERRVLGSVEKHHLESTLEASSLGADVDREFLRRYGTATAEQGHQVSPSRAAELVRALPSASQMVVFSEILGPPVALRHDYRR